MPRVMPSLEIYTHSRGWVVRDKDGLHPFPRDKQFEGVPTELICYVVKMICPYPNCEVEIQVDFNPDEKE